MTYKESINISKQALDLLNIKQFLIFGHTLGEIIDNIKNYVEDNNSEEIPMVYAFMSKYPEVFGDSPELFNYITDDEFLKYCQEKFPNISWGYEYRERYWVK